MKAIKETELSQESPFPLDVFISDNKINKINIPLHWHECVEIMYMLEGRANHRINNQDLIAEVNDIILINPDDVHGIECEGEDECRILVIKFLPEIVTTNYVNKFDSKYIRAFLSNKKERIYHISNTLDKSKDIYNLVNKIYCEFTSKEEGYELLLKGFIYQLIGYLIRNGLLNKPHEALLNQKHMESLKPLLNYIEQNYKEELNLENASKMMNLSYFYLSRYFKRITGKNFKEYIDYIRICEAEKLIVSQDMDITQVAYEVGFSSVSAFCRVFKKIRNYSPGTIKRAKSVYN